MLVLPHWQILLFDIILYLFTEGDFCSEETSGPLKTPCEPPQTVERNGIFLAWPLVMEPQWQIEPCFWDRAAPADWLTDSLSGSPGLFLLKCWNLRFFIVVWKGSLPVMQETERLPCSKNARFPGPIPWAASPGRSQNISSFRIQGRCIFILVHFFPPQRFQEAERELRLFLRSWLCVLSGLWLDV